MGWVVKVTLRPSYHRERDLVPIVQEAGWDGLDGCERSRLHRVWVPELRLRYPGLLSYVLVYVNK
jgi:hypothetical protein